MRSWLAEVASKMDTEDGCIWIYGIGDDEVLAFTDDGVDNLRELARMHPDCPQLAKVS